MNNKVEITIDNKKIMVDENITIMQACDQLDIQIPRFCYHARLSVSGNCRMCMVEIDGQKKPVTSCTTKVQAGQVIKTQSQLVKQARKDVMELLLANHPLDCPLCDQAGECDLQDLSVGCGSDKGQYSYTKRTVEEPDLGPYIQTFMNRCIHCMKCTRFSEEIAGKQEIAALFKGDGTIITNYNNPIKSNLSGNMIDLCPVGALTNKLAKYKARPWELTKYATIDVLDSICPSIYADVKNNQVIRIRARENDKINQEWISDFSRFCIDGITNNRILAPRVKQENVSWTDAFDEILENLQEINPKNITAYVGNFQAVEDLFSFKQFINSIGVNKIKLLSNSSNLEKSKVCFATTIQQMEQAGFILNIGVDLEQKSPVLKSRLFQKNINISDLYYDIKVSDKDVIRLKESNNSIILADADAILNHVDSDDIINYLQTLAEQTNSKVNFFSQYSGFINAVDIIQNNIKDENQNNDVLFIYGVENLDEELLNKAKCIIYIGTHENSISKKASIVLPSVTFYEKNSLWNNVEGFVQEPKAVIEPYAESKVDWKIWRALSEFTGTSLKYNNLEELRVELALNNQNYSQENIQEVTHKNIVVDNFDIKKIEKAKLSNTMALREINPILSNSEYK